MDCTPAALKWCEIEVIDPARVDAYVKNGLGPPGFRIGGLDPRAYQRSDASLRTFTSPSTDPAPWYDVATPESAEFLGIIADTPTGFGGVTTRESTDRLGYLGGVALSSERRQGRSSDWRVWIVGATVPGAQYGFTWLRNMLATACDSCTTCDAAVRLYFGDTYQVGRWLQYEVALVSGPTVADDMGVVIEVTFTLLASNPYLYMEPVDAITDAPLQGDSGFTECIPFDVWFCGTLPTTDVCIAIDRQLSGELAPILELDAALGGADGVHILMYDDCPDGQPGTTLPRGIFIPQLQAGWRISIDSAKGVINAWTPAGELVNGQSLVRTADHGDPFIRAATCDAARCICVGVDHPCGGGQDVLVNLQTQWRTI